MTVAVPPLNYVDKLQRANALELAFFPLDALRRGIERGHIVGVTENGDWAGYLWHGALRPQRDVVIYQACIDYDARRQHLGFELVRELLHRAETSSATGIRLRCASTSDSNGFWSAVGFHCTSVRPGGKSRNRDINEWRTDIQAGFFTLAVQPSDRAMDRRAFYASLRTPEGTGLLSRFAHPSRVRSTRVARDTEGREGAERTECRAGPPPADGLISWCRVFRIGPPCPRLCGDCAITNRRIVDPVLRQAILEGVEP